MISAIGRIFGGTIPCWISGTIAVAAEWQEAFGEYLQGVSVVASDDGEGEVSTTSDSGGVYQVDPKPYPGWAGTLTPSKAGWIFSPVSPAFDDPPFPTGQNFVATPGGLPATGAETSYYPDDDGDLRFGIGGFLPPTGAKTSYYPGDDGDRQFGLQ